MEPATKSRPPYPIHVCFYQARTPNFHLSKTIYLPAVPPPGSIFEYEEGWGMLEVAPYSERGIHLSITAGGIEISGYSALFTEEEVASLVALGWKDSRVAG